VDEMENVIFSFDTMSSLNSSFMSDGAMQGDNTQLDGPRGSSLPEP
jgi:hypothetical protein